MARSKDYQATLIEALRDPHEDAEYLNAAIEEGDRERFLLALRNVADARLGGMSPLAELTGRNRERLYRRLSGKGNPALSSLDKLLHALDLRLAVEVGFSKVA